MKLSLDLIESNKEIEKLILLALLPEVQQFMIKGINYIKSTLPTTISETIVNTPEYRSLVSGKLKLEFGIPDPEVKIAELLRVWSNNIHIVSNEPSINGNQIKGVLDIGLIRSDFSDVLGTDSAQMIDTLRGYSLPWLEWLLLEGNKTLVKNYQVIIGPSNRSRTGMAIMRESKQSWKVPSEFAGTISDNWITRALDNIDNEINNILKKAFTI